MVITTSTGVFLWNDDGTHMLFFLALSDITVGDVEYQYMRGIAGNEKSVFIGTSLGQILEISLPQSGPDHHIELVSKVSCSKNPITCLCTCKEYVICADDRGGFSAYTTSKHISSPIYSKKGDDYPCTSIVATDNSIIASFSTGHIRGYKLSTGELLVTLTAHIRCINGLAMHPSENIVVSVSEDQYISVWSIGDFSTRSGKSFDLLSSIKVDNHQCTGVGVYADGRVAVSSYDEDELVVVHNSNS
jgi:WD40 repeat protein